MADTIFHAGHSGNAITAPLGWTETAGRFNSDTSQNAVVGVRTAPAIVTLDSIAGDSEGIWVHAVVAFDSAFSSDVFELIAERSGLKRFALWSTESDEITVRLYAADGATYSTAASVWGAGTDVLYSLDFHLSETGGDETLNFYVDGVLTATVTRTQSGSGIDRLKLGGWYPSADTTYAGFWSEVCVANFDLRGKSIVTLPPTADGTHTDGGAYTDIDEQGTPDTSFIMLTTATDKQTFTTDGLDTTDYTIHGVVLNVLGGADGTNELHGVARISSTDYQLGSITTDLGVSPHRLVLMNDPSTTSAWTGDLSAVEFGVEAVAP